MSTIRADALAYSIESMITRRLRDRKVAKPGELAKELTEKVMAEIPPEAYDPRQAYSEGILFYHGGIDEEAVRDMQAELTTTHLNLPANKAMQVYLSSVGGDVFAGLALVSTIQEIQRSGRRVNIHVSGTAMSMASYVLQVGNVRSIEPYAFLMIHEEHYGIDGKVFQHRDELAFAERLDDAMCSLYSARSGKSIEYYKKKWERRDWFLSAQEALVEGLVDEIRVAPTYRRKRRKVNA